MFDAHCQVPKSLDGKENKPQLIKSMLDAANREYAEKKMHEQLATTGDKITLHQEESKKHGERAKTFHEIALRLQNEQTKFEKMKPTLNKILIGTVVFAELISIPVLLMSCFMMTKPGATTSVPQAAYDI